MSHSDIQIIIDKLDKLSDKIDNLIKDTERNRTDISWLKASGKASVGFILSILTGIVVFVIKLSLS